MPPLIRPLVHSEDRETQDGENTYRLIKGCQSCHQQAAVLSVQWPDFIILVCWGCKP